MGSLPIVAQRIWVYFDLEYVIVYPSLPISRHAATDMHFAANVAGVQVSWCTSYERYE